MLVDRFFFTCHNTLSMRKRFLYGNFAANPIRIACRLKYYQQTWHEKSITSCHGLTGASELHNASAHQLKFGNVSELKKK